MRAFLVACLIVVSISPLSQVYAGDNLIHSTQEIMYEAEEFASVPANFQPMSVATAQELLKTQASGQCQQRYVKNMKWKLRTDHLMSYGKQTYWIQGVFTCSDT